jgi:hypothetical protein
MLQHIYQIAPFEPTPHVEALPGEGDEADHSRT